MNLRVKKLRERLAKEGYDAIFVSTPENRRYLSGFTGSAGYLVISQEAAIIATDFRYYEQVGRQCPDFELCKLTGDLQSWLPETLTRLKVKSLVFEAQNVSFAFHLLLKAALAKMKPAARPKLLATNDFVEALRIYKDGEEAVTLRRAVAIADQAFLTVAPTIKPGDTEAAVAWRIEMSMKEQGADGPSFDTIVAAGPNSALPHHRPSEKRIERHEPIVLDFGARLHGYCSDITRTVFLGGPDATFRKVYDYVLAAQETAIVAAQAGMTGHDVDKLARDVIEKAGYGDKFGHGTGHGVGLLIHENPRVSRNATNELKDGMFYTVEPGIYLPGLGGVRIENIVTLEKGKPVNLTRAPKKEMQKL